MVVVLCCIAAVAIGICLNVADRPGGGPDGKCYLCRGGRCLPGEICPKCGTDQP